MTTIAVYLRPTTCTVARG